MVNNENNENNINKTNNRLSLQRIGHKKTTKYGVGSKYPGLEQTNKCGRVRLINGTPTLSLCNLDLQLRHRYNQMIKQRFVSFHFSFFVCYSYI